MKKAFVLTANHTLSGHSLYWHKNGHWQPDLFAAEIFEGKGAAADHLESAKKMEAWVCDPHLEAIDRSDGIIRPITTRQRLRNEADAVMQRLGYAEAREHV